MKNLIYIFICLLIVGCHRSKPTTVEVTDPVNNVDHIYIEETVKHIDFDTSEWAEIYHGKLVQLDIRYATANNFTKQQIYDCPRCFLNKETAKVFFKVVLDLREQGFGVKLFDCYRPHPAQQKLWDIVPNPMYVADPKEGSMHNRGLAVDLTLMDLDGEELDMGTAYDHFGKEAYHDYVEHDAVILNRRKVLKETMAKYGFAHTRTEWWHYSDTNHASEISSFEWPCEE